MDSIPCRINFFPCYQKSALRPTSQKQRKPIIISQCRSNKMSACRCLVLDDFIFLDKERRITTCFFNGQKFKATYLPTVVYIRIYKCKLNQWMSESFSQVMRNPALQWQWGLCALKHRFIWSVAEFPVPARACDSFKVLGRLGHLSDWSQHIALQMNWSPWSPELSATHFVGELHSSTHFPCKQQLL